MAAVLSTQTAAAASHLAAMAAMANDPTVQRECIRTKSVLPQIIALIIAPLLLRRLDPKVGGHRGVCCMQRQEMVICLMMVAMVGGAAAQDDCTGAHP